MALKPFERPEAAIKAILEEGRALAELAKRMDRLITSSQIANIRAERSSAQLRSIVAREDQYHGKRRG